MAQYLRLPEPLRSRPQWLLATPDSVGQLKVPASVRNGEIVPGSSTDPNTWLSFEQAAAEAVARGCGLGYVLHATDPFTCIDLDVKNAVNAPDKPETWTSQERIERYAKMAQDFSSYTEVSISGQGLHIWIQGKVGSGLRRDGVELYSQERFIVCTGRPYIDSPVEQRQELLTHLASYMRAEAQKRALLLEEVEAVESDSVIFERASTAANADKFNALCAGRWQEMGEYPSQSEADLALMSMFTFYSRSNEQCRRLFRATALGKREKAQKDDRYLNFTLRLIRERQAGEDRILASIKLEQQTKTEIAEEIARLQASTGPVQADSIAAGATVTAPSGDGLAWPPGAAALLAQFIHNSAPRPVKEVAIVAALGWLAGVCGKAWAIPQSGLNLYIILIARSAVGKEAMHSGLSILTNSLLNAGLVTAGQFVDFADFASGPALRKAVAANGSFVNVTGEWGRKLRRLSADSHNDGPMQSLRTEMTNLYQKSGPQSIVGGINYSRRDDNVASVSGVNYSMIGETTPNTYYEALTETMMEDGFLSRFLVIEYNGERPAANPRPLSQPDPDLLQWCGSVVMQAIEHINRKVPCYVQCTPEAWQTIQAFDIECDAQINKTLEESWRQMWNRAQLKAIRVAALLAVADNCYAPCVDVQHISWAIDLIRRDIRTMQRKIETGDVGTGDGTRERKVLAFCSDYLRVMPSKGYGIPVEMHRDGIIPRKLLQIRTQRMPIFNNAKLGSTGSLDSCIRSLCDSGYLLEVDRVKASDSYGFHGRCYRIVSLPDGSLD